MTGIVQSSKRELELLAREAASNTIALATTLRFAHGQTTERAIVAPPNDIARIGSWHERAKAYVVVAKDED